MYLIIKRYFVIFTGALMTALIGLLISGCGAESPAVPPDYSVISSPQVPVIETDTPTPPPTASTAPQLELEPGQEDASAGLFNMTPAAVLPTLPPSVTELPATPTENIALLEETAAVTPTEDVAVTPQASIPAAETPAAPPKSAAPPDEPRKGGSWDMEDGFEVWINPFGDNCSGSKVAVGWQGFTSRGQYGSSCLYLNEYGPNVFSGKSSQQVTFDFSDSQAGIFRTFDSKPGHKYQVTARLRHVHTFPAMQFYFGYDLSGGANWEGAEVAWAPWAEFAEDAWITHQQTITATGEKITVYIKGVHSTAAQGGATYIDAVEVIDLG